MINYDPMDLKQCIQAAAINANHVQAYDIRSQINAVQNLNYFNNVTSQINAIQHRDSKDISKHYRFENEYLKEVWFNKLSEREKNYILIRVCVEQIIRKYHLVINKKDLREAIDDERLGGYFCFGAKVNDKKIIIDLSKIIRRFGFNTFAEVLKFEHAHNTIYDRAKYNVMINGLLERMRDA